MKSANPYDGYYSNRKVDLMVDEGASLAPYFKKLLPENRGRRILDVGCGKGNMLMALRKEGYADLSGIDISAEVVDACSQYGFNVEKCDIRDFTVEDSGRKFDFIIMGHVLEHIPKEEIIDTLYHIQDGLLCKGGALYVAVPNAQSNTGCYWAYEDFTHHTLFTAGSLDYVLKAAGFAEVKFINQDGTEGLKPLQRLKYKLLLSLYRKNKAFWNRVTSSSYHRPSPQIFTYDIKALATRG